MSLRGAMKDCTVSYKLKNWLLPIEAINARESQSRQPVHTQQCGGVGSGGVGKD